MINARIDLSKNFQQFALDMPNIVRRQVGYAALRTTDVLAKKIKDEVDKEMATMAKTSLHYSALTSVIRSKFEGLKNIITEGQK